MWVYSEELIQLENLTEIETAKKEHYPTGAFAYSQILPTMITFPRPVQIQKIYLKQHRAPHYYLKKSMG